MKQHNNKTANQGTRHAKQHKGQPNTSTIAVVQEEESTVVCSQAKKTVVTHLLPLQAKDCTSSVLFLKRKNGPKENDGPKAKKKQVYCFG